MRLDDAGASERWIREANADATRTEFERDRDRVLHSSALRRLGAKTQVLGPESDDFIRTRLTHSLEVAQIGRALAKNLGVDAEIVETACLSHDLGHPPFGHNGERALAEVSASIGGFEGNAQTLRILTRLEAKRLGPDGRHAGLNLTRATLDACIKYPWGYADRPLRADGKPTPKFNVYDDDRDVFDWIRQGAGSGKCMEAQIMDLADDIAYSTHDVEDGIARGLIPVGSLSDPAEQGKIIRATRDWYRFSDSDALATALDRIAAEEPWLRAFEGSYAQLAQLKNLTSDLIGRFISRACEATLGGRTGEGLGRYGGDVVLPEETRAEIMVLKGLAVTYVMLPREDEPIYHEQRRIIFDLVDALTERPEALEPHLYEGWRRATSDAERHRIVVDQVASLTDQSARQWHSRLCGFLRN